MDSKNLKIISPQNFLLLLYWAIFIGSLIVRVALELLDDPIYWLTLVAIVPVTLLTWGRFVWRKMNDLYELAETSS